MIRKSMILAVALATGFFVFNSYSQAEEMATPMVADFTLQSVGDTPTKTFKLSENKGKHVVLHFLLKTTCPVCQRLTMSYYNELKDNDNVVQVFIKPDDPKVIEKWLGKMKDRPTIYHDPNAQLAAKYGVKDGFRFHGEVVHYPAFILLDENGKEVFRYVGKNNRDRFTYSDFAKKFPNLVK